MKLLKIKNNFSVPIKYFFIKIFWMPRIVDGKIVEDLESQTPTSNSNESGSGDFGMSQMKAGMNNIMFIEKDINK